MRKWIAIFVILALAAPVQASKFPGELSVEPRADHDFAFRVLDSSGTAALTVAIDGSLTIAALSATSALATFPVPVMIDDGSGDSPLLTLRDGDDKDLTLQKLTAGKAQILNTEGAIEIGPSNDSNDVIELSTTSDVPMIGTEGACDLAIKASGGDLILGGSDGTNNESINLDFEGTGNNVVVTTATGVTDFDFGSINVGTDALDVSDGNITNVGSIGADSLVADGSALALGGGTETVAIDSSDWDIGVTGIMTGIGAITSDGLFTGSLGLTITGAVVSLNASSNFAVNIATGSSSGAVSIGGNSNTVAVDSSDWNINATGDVSGFGTFASDGDMDLSATGGSTGDPDLSVAGYVKIAAGASTEIDNELQAHGEVILGDGGDAFSVASSALDISSAGAISNATSIGASGTISTSGAIDVDAGVNLADTTAGSDVTIGNSTGNITLASDNADLTCTDGSDNVFQVIISGGNPVVDLDLGTTNQLNIGEASTKFTLNSDALDIDNAGNISGAGTYSGGKITSSYLSQAGPVYASSGILTSEAQTDVTRGGTGVGTNTAYGVLCGAGTSDITAVAPSANTGAPLLSAGASANPAYGALNLAGGSNIVSGVLPLANGGTGVSDLSGSGALYLSAGVMTSEATLAVARGGTGLSSGTSGGVLAYTASGTIASSGALTSNAIVLGGGAGAAPSVLGSLGTTTTVLHGNAAGAPSFSAISLTADVSGALPLANGGTGAADISTAGPVFVSGTEMTSEAQLDVTRGGTGVATNTAYGVLCGAGASDITAVAPSANTGAPLLSAGASANPAYGALNLAGGSNIVSGVLPLANGGTGVSDLSGSGAVYLSSGVMTSEATLAVTRGGTGLSGGTSGGIPYYSGAATIASSGALTQYAPVIGGGAGGAPATITAGTNTQALFGATGAAPSFRAIGDDDIPPALTLSGSTIENSPIGASTANTGRFTTCTVTSKFSGAEVENSGNVTIDAVNAGANSNVYVQNSAETYTASLNVDGDLLVSGHSDSKISIQNAIEVVDVNWTYNGANGAWKITGGGGALSGKVIHIRLQDLVVGEEITGWRIEGMVGATGGATTEVEACMYKVAAAATDPSASAVGTAMTQIDVDADTKLDNGVTFAAETVAAETEYYIAVTGGVSNNAACDIQVLCAEVDLNRKP